MQHCTQRFSLSKTRALCRFASYFVVKGPTPSATRAAPTPLVFCSAQEWAPQHHTPLSAYSTFLRDRGFTCIENYFVPPANLKSRISTSEELMEVYSSELRTNLQSSGSPFPPVIFASGFASLIAQTFISSHPAQGLFLVSPPPSNTSLYPHTLPTRLPEFNYELQFPVALMAKPEEMKAIGTYGRFSQSTWVDLIEIEDPVGERALYEVERWVDELGI